VKALAGKNINKIVAGNSETIGFYQEEEVILGKKIATVRMFYDVNVFTK
jgi:hypothetical protein